MEVHHHPGLLEGMTSSGGSKEPTTGLGMSL